MLVLSLTLAPLISFSVSQEKLSAVESWDPTSVSQTPVWRDCGHCLPELCVTMDSHSLSWEHAGIIVFLAAVMLQEAPRGGASTSRQLARSGGKQHFCTILHRAGKYYLFFIKKMIAFSMALIFYVLSSEAPPTSCTNSAPIQC